MCMAEFIQPKLYLKEWRLLRQLTQEAAADEMGLAQSYYSDLERGDKRWNAKHVAAAAKTFHCTPADLLRDPDKPDAIGAVWDEIPEDLREQALRVLETFRRNKNKTP